MGKRYTEQENAELNKELKKLQNRAKRLILSDYYDNVAMGLSEDNISILQRLTNAETHQDINSYLWNSGIFEIILNRIAEMIKQDRRKNRTYKKGGMKE